MAIPLERLLSLAGRGSYVFPLQPDGKKPFQDTTGLLEATTDPERIRAWYEQYPGCNWGLNCGRSGLLVVDLDTKKHNGIAAWEHLVAEHGSTPTTCVTTPSGGKHLYFKGDARTTASTLAKGIDTRGDGGYVLLPGCTVDGKPYELVGGALAELPVWLAEKLKPVEIPAASAPTSDLDSAAAILRAGEYLKEAPPAIEGEGGDATTLRVAMRVKDLGISEDTCVELMATAYNPRCVPPWEDEELARKVRNAYAYGKNAPGSAGGTPFQPVEPIPAETQLALAITADEIDISSIPKRRWILGHRYIGGFVTATISPGGVGKSSLSLLEAMAISTGRPLTGDTVHERGPVWIYNTEDPIDEMRRRVAAASLHHRIPLEELSDLHLSSGRSRPLVLAASSRGAGLVTNERGVLEVVDYIRSNGIKVWMLDPFVHAHQCDENSNPEMAHVMLILGKIAEKTGCAISLVHHTRKLGKGGGEGDMDTARGASALSGAARVMHTLGGMTEQDAPNWGIKGDDRRWYVRLDDAKANMAPPADLVRWFRKVDKVLPNGDHVGTLEPANLSRVIKTDLMDAKDAVIEAIQAGKLHAESYQISEVIPVLKDLDKELQRFKGKKADTIASQIRESFEGALVYVPGRLLTVTYDGEQLVIRKSEDWLS